MSRQEKPDHVDRIIAQWKEECPQLDVSSMGVFGRIARLAKLCEKARSDALADFGFKDGEFDVMATLRRAGSPYTLSPTALYRSLMLTSGAMTNRLNRLEQKGWIERLPNLADRRGMAVRLTDGGLTTLEDAVIIHLETQNAMLAGLRNHDRVHLAALLKTALAALPNDGMSTEISDDFD